MSARQNVLRELREKTRWVRSHLDHEPRETRRWRCPSCGQLLEYTVKRITLLNGTKEWEINVVPVEANK
jgi:hypothetical protein